MFTAGKGGLVAMVYPRNEWNGTYGPEATDIRRFNWDGIVSMEPLHEGAVVAYGLETKSETETVH